ncbi:hypothetical protein AWC38_SpisGene3157 [Stylophora pistillata]|uniref:Uncharacterized protein n=1 Tax=Stylophora pistillata TaxID=50429 RepID=A0A2B4STT3_STYPI|nr:hypothetical protein AWC38_SpisGene3157 [Stylophora pistillata]
MLTSLQRCLPVIEQFLGDRLTVETLLGKLSFEKTITTTMELSKQEAEELQSQEQEGDFSEKPRKVRWSLELEEVHYFVPLPQKKDSRWKKTIKCIKEKALDWKHNPLMLLGDVHDRNNLHLLSTGLVFLTRKVNNRSDKVDFEDIRDINKYWDELFELYSTHEVVSCDENNSRNSKFV